MKENVKRLEEEKYRCAFCSKLFRGDEFVRKHVLNKHPENVNEVKQKVRGLKKRLEGNFPKIIRKINLTIKYRHWKSSFSLITGKTPATSLLSTPTTHSRCSALPLVLHKGIFPFPFLVVHMSRLSHFVSGAISKRVHRYC